MYTIYIELKNDDYVVGFNVREEFFDSEKSDDRWLIFDVEYKGKQRVGIINPNDELTVQVDYETNISDADGNNWLKVDYLEFEKIY